MSDQEPVTRVDSSTPEGRLWNWLAENWERTVRSNNAQADRIGAVQRLIEQAQLRGVETVDTHDLLEAIGMDRWYEFPGRGVEGRYVGTALDGAE